MEGGFPNVLFEFFKLIHDILWRFRKINFRIFPTIAMTSRNPATRFFSWATFSWTSFIALTPTCLSKDETTIEKSTSTFLACHYHRKTHIYNILDEGNSKLAVPFNMSMVFFVALNAYSFLSGTSLPVGAFLLQHQVKAMDVQSMI